MTRNQALYEMMAAGDEPADLEGSGSVRNNTPELLEVR